MRPYSPESPWRLDPSITFLNHGSFGACPVPVLEAQQALRDRMEANPVDFLWRQHDHLLDEAREVLAAFIHADPEGLVFVPNATTGVSTVLRSLRFEAGDEIVTTDHEYNATLNAVAEVARATGARAVMAHIPQPIADPREIVDAIVGAVTSRTRLALVSAVTSPTAIVMPIEAIVRELDLRGVDTLVDAAHAPGMLPVDVRALGAAYWTANGHKWLCGPKGSGLLHVREDRRHLVRPLVVSHGWNDPGARPRLWKEFDWTGTTDPTPFLALADAVRIVGALHPGGWPGLMAADHRLALEARALLHEAIGGSPMVPDAMVGSMASVPLPGAWTDAELERLKLALIDEDRIEVPTMEWPVRAARRAPDDPPDLGFIRVSAQLYNEAADYERLAQALARRLTAAGAR